MNSAEMSQEIAPHFRRTRPGVFTALTARRTWSELLYAILGLPIGVAAFAFTASEISVGASLLVTLVGIPLIAVTGWVSRWLGSGLRVLANQMIGADARPPQPFQPKPGPLGWMVSCLTDATAWRARLYLLLKLPIGIASFVAAVVCIGYGLAGVTYAAWRPFLPCDGQPDAVCHRAAHLGAFYFDTPVRVGLVLIAGAGLLLIAPWAIRGVVAIDRLLIRRLLGPTGN